MVLRTVALRSWAVDVDDGEDGFLDEEADHLDFLEDRVAVDEVLQGVRFEVVGVGAECEDRRYGVQEEAVDDDHVERPAQNLARVGQEMQAGP
jgi:hypothetical protein